MKLLLDTHVVLWAWGEPERIAPGALAAILDPANLKVVSAASAWEAAVKSAVGRLELPEDFSHSVAASGFEPLAISVEDALVAGALPVHHRDPFDRMLVAQAQRGEFALVTRDDQLTAYDVAILRA
ncbi:MAG: type II toxin-antitoxin system VapC family toxin [Sporichthyaceae bacterium]